MTRKDVFKGPKLFDLGKQQTNVTTRLIDVLEDEVDEKYYLSDEKVKKLTLNNIQGGDSHPKIAIVGNTSETNYYSSNVYSENGVITTLAARDYKSPKQIAIREATKQGYAIAKKGDSVNVSYPTSKTRRGRVGKQVAQTLQAGEVNQGVVINNKICRRCNNKLKPSDIDDYEYVCFECDENFYEFETKDELKAIIGST